MSTLSTPINTLSRDNLFVLIRNNVMDESCEFSPAADVMETDSPMRKPTSLQPIIKKLFHSPMPDSPTGAADKKATRTTGTTADRSRKARKRKQILLPDSCEKIKRAYVKECDAGSYSPEMYCGIRKKVLISLFHNKEYSMDFD